MAAADDGSRWAIWWMIFSGVFERHPRLRLVIAENPGAWWTPLMEEMDSIAMLTLPKKPSEYAQTNLFHGATFLSKGEAERAVADGYYTNTLWGSDYPHIEGTWQLPHSDDEETYTHKSLRYTFAEIPLDKTRAMVGLNAIDVYGLDRDHLQAVANRIQAPTKQSITEHLDTIPDDPGMFAFRTVGPWG
jgi:predicted TIM-barrel fold metal-dependent hydrolase